MTLPPDDKRGSVSVITLHRVKNYGSVLQTLATQVILQKHFDRVEVVDYWRPDLTDSVEEIVERSRWNGSRVLRTLFITLRRPWANRNRDVFSRFVESRIRLSARSYFDAKDLGADPPRADVYCVGSDQVWNDDYNVGGSGPYFLDFAPDGAPRIALASSLGKRELTQVEDDYLRSQVSKFSAVSVREGSSVELLAERSIASTHVLDPTLMLTGEEWLSTLSPPIRATRYLLVYQLNRSAHFDQIVREISRRERLRVVRVVLKAYLPPTASRVVQPDVEEWVGLFAGAKHVVTDSFHGTAFSINLNVPFTVVRPPKYSERISSLLNLTALSDRAAATTEELVVAPIDWTEANRRLQAARESSLRFVAGAVKA